jgi:hypothetical protein
MDPDDKKADDSPDNIEENEHGDNALDQIPY